MIAMWIIGAIVLYTLMALSTFIVSHMIVRHVFEVRREVALPMAIAMGLFFPLTAVLLLVSMPIMMIIWYVRSDF